MQKNYVRSVFAVLALAVSMTGCVTVATPAIGGIYTSVKHGDTATSNAVGAKSGQSCATSILGLIATGDASVGTAASKGGITTISHVDHSSMSILGIYGEYCTIVSGN